MKLNFKHHLSSFKSRLVSSGRLIRATSLQQRIGALAALVGIILAIVFHDSPALIMIGTIELILIALVVNSFVFIYLHRNWRANPYGRAMMYSKISLALLVNLSLVTVMLGPEWPWRGTVRIILFGVILFSQARLLQLLYSLRNAEARTKYDAHHDSEGREI